MTTRIATGTLITIATDNDSHGLPLDVPHTVVSQDEDFMLLVAEGTAPVTGDEEWNSGRRGERAVKNVTEGSEWTVVPTGKVAVGARVKVDGSRGRGVIGNYTVQNGWEGTVVRMEGTGDDTYDATYVNFDESHNREDAVFNEVLVVLSGGATPAPETLAEFKARFLDGAVATAAANGGDHPEQVRKALDHLAREEFIDPSADLLAFQKRVVRLAMASKVKHNWCGEPERYLRSIGLGDLIPVKKRVKVTTYVEVFAQPGESDWSVSDRGAALVSVEAGPENYVSGGEVV